MSRLVRRMRLLMSYRKWSGETNKILGRISEDGAFLDKFFVAGFFRNSIENVTFVTAFDVFEIARLLGDCFWNVNWKSFRDINSDSFWNFNWKVSDNLKKNFRTNRQDQIIVVGYFSIHFAEHSRVGFIRYRFRPVLYYVVVNSFAEYLKRHVL